MYEKESICGQSQPDIALVQEVGSVVPVQADEPLFDIIEDVGDARLVVRAIDAQLPFQPRAVAQLHDGPFLRSGHSLVGTALGSQGDSQPDHLLLAQDLPNSVPGHGQELSRIVQTLIYVLGAIVTIRVRGEVDDVMGRLGTGKSELNGQFRYRNPVIHCAVHYRTLQPGVRPHEIR